MLTEAFLYLQHMYSVEALAYYYFGLQHRYRDDKFETIHLQSLNVTKLFFSSDFFMGRSRKKRHFWHILMATKTGDKWSTSVGPDILIHHQGSASLVWPSSDQNSKISISLCISRLHKVSSMEFVYILIEKNKVRGDQKTFKIFFSIKCLIFY